jgi:hypothetical protein
MQRKGIPLKEDWFDRMGPTELAAHFFRTTQARERLEAEGICDEARAIDAHADVGRIVRQSMKRGSGVMPEDLRARPSLKKLKKLQQAKLAISNGEEA